jgi:hypothetical protein
MKTLKETWTEGNFPTMKFADTWRDCVPVIDTAAGFIDILYVKCKVNKTHLEMSLCVDKFPVKYTMTEEEVGKKVLSMFEEFHVFEKMPNPNPNPDHSEEVAECFQVNRARHRVAVCTRRGCGNIIFDNRIVLYIGTGRLFNSIDAGIAVAHNNGMYGIATIPNWQNYGVVIK